MAWAKFPTHWLLQPPREQKPSPLVELTWRDYRAAGTAALLILIILSVRLNERNRSLRRSADRDEPPVQLNSVQVTWDDLQENTGFARATIGRAISLLEAWGAISVTKLGRCNVYHLLGVELSGGWCKFPETFVEANGNPVARFKGLPPTIIGLNALKLYVVLLALRSTKFETTAISYDGITRWTGIRREHIRKAWGFLDGQQLATVTYERDERHGKSSAGDQSHRYAIVGLTPGYTRIDSSELRNLMNNDVDVLIPIQSEFAGRL
jgi:hypothetical protein